MEDSCENCAREDCEMYDCWLHPEYEEHSYWMPIIKESNDGSSKELGPQQ